MALTVEAYNAAERAAIEAVPNRITEACRPELFLKAGYPVEVTTDVGLGRFVDVMHESRDESDYRELLSGFTADEFELFKEISTKVAELSESSFGRRAIPKGALTRAMLSFRHICMLAPPSASIFEIGPGSGYLGALLATAGYRYAATDIAQGFYLYQNRLWTHLFGARVLELAEGDSEFEGLGEIPQGGVIHVPWWKYTTINARRINTPIDVYIANHALNEMNLYSLCYTVRLSHQLLSNSQNHGYFFIENAGGDIIRARAATFHHFLTNGFARAFEDGGLVDVLVPKHKLVALAVADRESVPLTSSIKPALASSETAGIAMRLRRQYTYVRREVESHGGVVPTTLKVLRHPGILLRKARRVSDASITPAPAETSIHRKITEQRAAIGTQPKISFDIVRRFQSDQMDGEDLRSGDEQFFEYVFGSKYYS